MYYPHFEVLSRPFKKLRVIFTQVEIISEQDVIVCYYKLVHVFFLHVVIGRFAAQVSLFSALNMYYS